MHIKPQTANPKLCWCCRPHGFLYIQCNSGDGWGSSWVKGIYLFIGMQLSLMGLLGFTQAIQLAQIQDVWCNAGQARPGGELGCGRERLCGCLLLGPISHVHPPHVQKCPLPTSKTSSHHPIPAPAPPSAILPVPVCTAHWAGSASSQIVTNGLHGTFLGTGEGMAVLAHGQARILLRAN